MQPIPSRRRTRRLRTLSLALVFAFVGVLGAPTAAAADTTYSVSGHVSLGTGANSAGAGDVIVYLRALGPGTNGLSATTDSAGNYIVSGVGPGSYYSLYFRYSGTGEYSSEWLGNVPSMVESPPEFAVTSSDVPGENITLPTYQTVQGTVYDHTTPLTTAPAGSVTVSWTRSSDIGSSLDIDADGSEQVGADGTFSVSLPAGYYFMYFQSNSPDWASTDNDSERVVVGSSPVTAATVTLQGEDVVSGHVDLGEAGNPAGAGAVEIYADCYQSCPAPLATTDSNGNFSFSQVEGGPTILNLVFVYQGTDYQATSLGVAIPDFAYRVYSGEDVTLLPAASISGTIDLGTSGPAPADSVTVYAYPQDAAPESNPYWANVAADGDYTIPGLTTGSYILDFVYTGSDGYASAYWTTAALSGGWLAATGEDATAIDANTSDVGGRNITLPVGAYISGTLTGSNGEPYDEYDAITLFRSDSFDDLADGTNLEEISPSDRYVPDSYTVGPLLPGAYLVQFASPSAGVDSSNYPEPDTVAYPWAGSTPAEPWNADAYVLEAGDTVSDADGVVYLDSDVALDVTCSNCAEDTPVYIQLEAHDPVTKTWFTIDPAEVNGEIVWFYGLYPGTYRALAERTSDGAIVGTGTPFQVTEGEESGVSFDFAYTNPRVPVYTAPPLRVSVTGVGSAVAKVIAGGAPKSTVVVPLTPSALTTERELRVVGR